MSATRDRIKIPQDLKAEWVIAERDTREQLPLDLSPLRMVEGTRQTGDYGLAPPLQDLAAIERKSLQDLVQCVGRERERFEKEIVRLLGYPTRCVVVESTWAAIEAGGWKGDVTPAAVVGSVLSWTTRGIPFLFVGTHEAAGRAVAKMLYLTARRRWKEARPLVEAMLNGQGGER